MERLFGLETEYGFAAHVGRPQSDRNADAAWDLVDAVRHALPCLPDSGAGGVFLANGSRLYVDSGHPELATPEVSTPWDAVRYTIAGQRILERALARTGAVGRRPRPLLFTSNVDYLTRDSWGCHESILYRPGMFHLAGHLIPHLVSRVIFTGAGGFDPFTPGLSFVLSPRATYLQDCESNSSTHTRGIVHTKDEPLGVGAYRRLHLICGESLCSERGMWLKTATTVLVVAMIEAGLTPGPRARLADPIAGLHTVIRDPACRAAIPLAAGGTTTALALQRHFLSMAEKHTGAAFMPRWTEAACDLWRATLDELERGPGSIATTLDWAIKRALFERVLARHGLDWNTGARWTAALEKMWETLRPTFPEGKLPDSVLLTDPTSGSQARRRDATAVLQAHGFDWAGLTSFLRARRGLFECDTRFGQLGGDGIFATLEREGVLTHHVPGVDDIEYAVEHPPASGRAHVRGQAVRRLADDPGHYVCDWTSIRGETADTFLDLSDPFVTEERWRPVRAPREETPQAQELPLGPLVDRSPLRRRGAALHDFLDGNHASAERRLLGLLAEGYEVPGTHCHLARLYLSTGQHERARHHVGQAWEARLGAPRYVLARTLWLQTLVAVLEGGDWRTWVGRLKRLALDRQEAQPWAMEPVLDGLERRLPDETFAMMIFLFQVVSGADDRTSLDRFAWWTDVEPAGATFLDTVSRVCRTLVGRGGGRRHGPRRT